MRNKRYSQMADGLFDAQRLDELKGSSSHVLLLEFERLTGGGRWEKQGSPHGQSVF